VVHEIDIERDVDGGYEDEHVSRRIHDPWREAGVSGIYKEVRV
jgi:hypothetical protein